MTEAKTPAQKKEQKQVLFANDASTVHVLLSPEPITDELGNEAYATESKLLLPGEYVGTDEVPPYLLEKVKSGEAETLEFMPESKAQKISAEAAKIRADDQDNAIKTVGPGTVSGATDKVKRSISQAKSD